MGATVVCRLPDLPIIEMMVDGILTADDGAEAMKAGLALSQLQGVWSTLADFTHMRQTAPPGDIIHLADLMSQMGVADMWQEAVVLPFEPTTAVWVRLWEAAAVNRGLRVKSFPDREDAIARLLAKDPVD